FDAGRLHRLGDVMSGHVKSDRVGGVAWLASCGEDVEVGVAGTLTRGEPQPVTRDSVFRIASMTKPIVAVAAPLLVEELRFRLYNTGADVLGVLIARAAGQPLEEFLSTRVFQPLGMVDTGFSTDEAGRLSSCYATDPATGRRRVYDPPTGQWATSPAFPSGGGGLV